MDLCDLRPSPLCVAPLYFRLKWEHYFGPMRSRLLTALSGLALLGLPWRVLAGGDDVPIGARFGAMGNAGITLVDLWSIRHNPAGLAGLETPMAGIYFQSHWLSPDLTMKGLAAATPLGQGTLGLTVNDFGYELYREQRFGLAYAMRFGEALRASVQFDYLGVRLGEGYGNTSAITAGLGMQARITEKLWIGAHLYNPNRAELGGPTNERVPTVLRAGMGYTFSDKLTVTGEAAKDIDREASYRAGIEYHPTEVLYLRTGVSTGPVQGHGGIGLRLKRLDVDLAVSFRSTLGATPQVNVNYRFP